MSRQITVIGELPSQNTSHMVKKTCVGFWHVQSAKSMHQGTLNCGTATAVHFARVLAYWENDAAAESKKRAKLGKRPKHNPHSGKYSENSYDKGIL